MYDSIHNSESTSTIFLSPYGFSYITLTNNYRNINQRMTLRIMITKGLIMCLLPF